ncbi:MAG: hypothetical protein RLZZ306_518 [Bacteroidota bacterium]|jgi:hypothetical protein
MKKILSIYKLKIGRVLKLILIFLLFFSETNSNISYHFKPTKKENLVTLKIQKSIDSCHSVGGGTVFISKGTYILGTLTLKSNVKISLEKGAILQGSDNYKDYTNDAFIFAKDAQNIAIEGEGIIDGVDCFNPNGEENFRGPHCIRFVNCKRLSIKGIEIRRSANWAINCRNCRVGTIENVSIKGGHDGLHTRFCQDFKVSGCDFRTGDDAFAGNDNQNFEISDCKINTSCNGFRMGCNNLKVSQCKLWGPGEYQHKIQKRNNMLAAFVHFSPKDDNSKIKSGNWILKDIEVDNVDNFYNYNFKNGLWQTGQPITKIIFENIKAKGLLKAFEINGGNDKKAQVLIKNSEFLARENLLNAPNSFEGAEFSSNAFFNALNIGFVKMESVKFLKNGVSKTVDKTVKDELRVLE